MDTDIHFYHVPTHADASRKRITEDTEDWRPRTGTTQSRSFRILAQITGTENGTMSGVFDRCDDQSVMKTLFSTAETLILFALSVAAQEQEADTTKKKK